MFLHTYPFIPISGYDCVSLSFSFSLSDRSCMAPKACKSTSGQNPLQGSSSFTFSHTILPPHVRFRDEKAWKDFLEKLSEMWHSFEVPCCFVKLFQHPSPCHHLDLGLGISTWETLEVFHCVYIGVSLQYTPYRYLYTLVCHDISR